MGVGVGLCPACGAAVGPADDVCPACDAGLRAPERRLVTLLFADLTGYTRLCQHLDPEDVHLTIAPLMTRLRRTAEQLGALVESVQGDGFLATWGARLARADDVRRAITAAVRMQHAVTAWREDHPSLQLQLPGLHAAVHVAEVLVAPARSTIGLSVTGDGVNVGSRLCGLASEEQVLLSADAIAVAGVGLPLDATREHPVRGRDAPVAAAVLRWREYDERAASAPRRSEVPLVDRIELRAALELLAAGAGTAVLVGEPGVGKSRVIGEVLRGLEQWVVLRGVVPGFGALGWTDPLGAALRSSAATPTVPGLLELTPGWSPGGLVERRLGRLIGAPAVGSEADSEADLAGAFRAWWEALLGIHPAALVIDDLHHASPELLDLLAALPRTQRSLVVGTARDERTAWGALPVVPVPPLGAEESSTLVERLLPGMQPDLAAEISARTGGNPLFAEEVSALLLERGTVELTEHGVTLVDPAGLADIPTSLRLLVLARLDLISPLGLEVVRGASVLGFEFPARELELLLSSVDVEAGLREGHERGMLVRRGSGWAFRHSLLRDVAYSSMSRSQRERMHVSAAAITAAERSDPGDATSALHTTSAWECSCSAAAPHGDHGLAWRAVDSLARVADHLSTRRPHACRLLLDRARVTAEALPEEDTVALRTRLALLDLEASLAEGLEAEVLEAAQVLLSGPLSDRDRGDVLLLRGRALWVLDELEQARAELHQAALALDSAGAPARAAQARAIAAFTTTGTLPELIEGHLAGWAPAVASGDTRIQVDLATNLATDLSIVAGPGAAHWRGVVDGLLADSDHVGRAWLELATSYAASFCHDWTRCWDTALRARDVGRDASTYQLHLSAQLLLPEAALHLGRFDDCARELAALHELIRDRANPRSRFYAAVFAAALAARTGDHERVRAELAAAEQLHDSVPASDGDLLPVYRAQIQLQSGDWPGAEQDARHAASRIRALGMSAVEITPLLTLLTVRVGRSDAEPIAQRLLELTEHALSPMAERTTRRLLAQHRLLSGGQPDEVGAALSLEHRALDLELGALTNGAIGLLRDAAEAWASLGWWALAERARVWHATAAGSPYSSPRISPSVVDRWRHQWLSRPTGPG